MTVSLGDFNLASAGEDAAPLLTRWLSDPRVFESDMSDVDPRSRVFVTGSSSW
jgi:hypothetical protein